MAAVICWVYSFRCFPLDYTMEPTCNLDFTIRTHEWQQGNWDYFCLIIENYFVFTYLLTYSIEQSPSWDTNLFSASEEIPHIFWHSNVQHRVYKSPPPVPILSQIKDALCNCDFVHYDVQTVFRIIQPRGTWGTFARGKAAGEWK